MRETLYELGEEEILNRLKIFMPPGQIDDDTADIDPLNKKLLINTDILVENIHFSEETTSPRDVGWKAVSSNFSDLACSGVEEIIGITIGMVALPNTQWHWVNEVYKGIEDALNVYGGNLLGGDCSTGQQKILAITAIGRAGELRLHRSNAMPGDLLVASGSHGLSRLGLALLQFDPCLEKYSLTEELKQAAIKSHKRPKPALKALKILKECKPSNLPWRAAGTDSSDGLLNAVQNLCLSSKCQAVLDPKKFPKHIFWPKGQIWDQWCLEGGEDFELIVSLPAEWAKTFQSKCPDSQIIGYMEKGKEKIVWEDNQYSYNKDLKKFKHFQ